MGLSAASPRFGLDLQRGFIPNYYIPLTKPLLQDTSEGLRASDGLVRTVAEKLDRPENNLDDVERGGFVAIGHLEKYFKTPEARTCFQEDLMRRIAEPNQRLSVDNLMSDRANSTIHFDGPQDKVAAVALLYEPPTNIHPETGRPTVTDVALLARNTYSKPETLLSLHRNLHPEQRPLAEARYSLTLPEYEPEKPFLVILNNQPKRGMAHWATPALKQTLNLPAKRPIHRVWLIA